MSDDSGLAKVAALASGEPEQTIGDKPIALGMQEETQVPDKAAQAEDYGDSGQSGASRSSKGSVISEAVVAAANRCSPFGRLKEVTLLGDSCDAEELKFGNQIENVSVGAFALQRVGQWPLQMFRILIMSIPSLINIAIFASLPCNGDKDTTKLSAGLFGVLNTLSALTSIMTPSMTSAHRNKLDIVRWVLCTFGVLCLLNGGLQIKLFEKGKSGKGLLTQLIVFPCGIICSIANGKMNVLPGWRPKWNTCCCVFGGIDKATGQVAFASLLAFISGITLIQFVRQDTLVLSTMQSKSMLIVRPMMFFFVKKLVYHAFANGFSRVRHPVVTRASTLGVSVMLGIATAILFTNTRTWLDLFFIVAGNWFTFCSKMWTLTGSKWSGKCKLLALYSWFMSTGKPIVAPNENKVHLRGFEIQAQNFGTTLGLVIILAFYPIAVAFFGQESMIFKLLFASDLSTTFLLLALANEIIEDNLGQLLIGCLTNCDFSKLYSFWPSDEVFIGLQMSTVFVTVICSSGWIFRATKVGPFAEA